MLMLVEPGLYIGGSQEGTSPKDVKMKKKGGFSLLAKGE